MIQGYKLGEDDFRGRALRQSPSRLKGNNDLLTLTRPDIIRDIGRQPIWMPAPISSRPIPSIPISPARQIMASAIWSAN